MRLLRLIPSKTNLPFARWGSRAVIVSLIMLGCSAILIGLRGFELGVDFTGGLLFQLSTSGKQQADLPKLRALLKEGGLGGASVQTLESSGQQGFIIRLPASASGADSRPQSQAWASELKAAIGNDYSIESFELVGPQISGELIRGGLIAVTLAVALMFLYVCFRFSWPFAVGAVLALIHDILLTMGALSLTRYEVNLSTVAALLTIVGYSMNDTVVVFDRIRENMRASPDNGRHANLSSLISVSINETLSRTIMTSTTTLLSLLALLLFGGEALRGFIFAMMFGIIVGTYSSIFIASPTLLFLSNPSDRKNGELPSPSKRSIQ